MLYSLLQRILTMCGRILSRLVDLALNNTRRFDRIDERLARLEDDMARILAAVEPLPVASVEFTVYFEGQTTEGATHMQLKDTQQFDFTLSGKDAKGGTANIDGTKTTATVDDPTVATVTLNPDGLGGTIVAGLTGKTQLQVSVTDAVNTGDVQKGSLDIEVLPGDLATIQIGTSAPVDQPPATPPAPAAAQ